MNKTTATLLATACFAGPAFAQGDDCTAPTAINAFGTFAFDSTASTTSGFNGGGSCVVAASTLNQDVFWVYTATTAGEIQFDTDGSTFDTQLSIHSGAGCAATCLNYDDDGGVGAQSFIRVAGVTPGMVFLVQVGGFGTESGIGQLNIGPFVDPCATMPDDSLEENDTCAAAVTVTAGSFPGLFVSLTDSDFYSITLQPNEVLDFTITNDANADVDLNLFDSACVLQQTLAADALTVSNLNSTTPTTYIVEVFVDPLEANDCTTYDLDVVTSSDPCTALLPDSFEDNDDCLTAVVVGDGFYPSLTVFDNDNDYFAIGLDPGATLTADIFFFSAGADVDLYLWDPAVECDTNVAGTGGAFLTNGFTSSNDESITWTNTTGAPQNLILEIDMFTAGGCNTYDLQLAGTNGPAAGLGISYCATNPNSTGLTGEIKAEGSVVATANNLTVTATNLPPLGFGFFIASRVQGFVMNPGGSQGNLCLGGAIGRYVGPGQIMNSGIAGVISLALDLTAVPQPQGFEAVVAGDTWNFQLWHRDSTPAGPTSNFTNGVSIDFI